jgi:hypothetical protein
MCGFVLPCPPSREERKRTRVPPPLRSSRRRREGKKAARGRNTHRGFCVEEGGERRTTRAIDVSWSTRIGVARYVRDGEGVGQRPTCSFSTENRKKGAESRRSAAEGSGARFFFSFPFALRGWRWGEEGGGRDVAMGSVHTLALATAEVVLGARDVDARKHSKGGVSFRGASASSKNC